MRDVKKGAHTTNECGCECSVCNRVFDQDSMTCQGLQRSDYVVGGMSMP
jgi:hypothetical protein